VADHIFYGARVFSVRRLLALLAVLVGLVKLCACSVLLDSQVRQCQSDEDCARFGDSVCDVEGLVCVPRPPRADAAATPATTADAAADAAVDSCVGTNGCFACAPHSDLEYLNACSDGRCLPFDNRRLRNLNADGTLKPLPPP
jgi:hypothetical protein